jgi:hypothetical protein
MSAVAPYWQRYGSGPARPAIVCMAQRGPELWSVRADGRRCWMQQGPLWYELNAPSARQVLLMAKSLQSGADSRLCLTLRPCRAVGDAAQAYPEQPASATTAEASAAPSGDRVVTPLRAWSGDQPVPEAAASTVRVMHKRSRRIVKPSDNAALSE